MKDKRIRIKVCGMTRTKDVEDAVALGVDAIGVILHANSQRLVNVERAKELRSSIPAFVSMVGVFVDAQAKYINQLAKEIGLDLIQLHGAESVNMASQLDKPYIKAIRAKSKQYVYDQIEAFPEARACLIDPYVVGQHGGTGKQLDNALWPQNVSKPVILAGGLSPFNIAQAAIDLKPYAVDLNSGVEISPGVKSSELIEQAISAIR